jgi:hypothetical protein
VYLAICPQEIQEHCDLIVVHSDDDAALPQRPLLRTDTDYAAETFTKQQCAKHLEANAQGVHSSSRPERACKRKMKVRSSSSSSSSDEKVPKQHFSASARSGVHSSVRPYRSVKVEKDSSSSEVGAALLPHQPPAPAHSGVHSSLRPYRSVKVKKDSSSSTSSSDESEQKQPAVSSATILGRSFKAKDSSNAKLWLAAQFEENHTGGRIRCVNSRWNYVYLECKQCVAKCAASLQGSNWVVSKAPLSGHCLGALPGVSSLVAASSVSFSPAPAPVILPPPPPNVSPHLDEFCQCCMCYDPEVPVADATFCTNVNHAYCKECFGNHIKNLCENRVDFMKKDCRVFCMKCSMDESDRGLSSEGFDMQTAVAK